MQNETVISDQELVATVDDLLKDKETLQTFDLPVETVRDLLKVRVTKTGFDISPNFQSAGWGENDTEALAVNLSDLGGGEGVLKHELRHALHCLVCTDLFNRGLDKSRLDKFVSDVLNDSGFYEWRKGLNGEPAEKQWNKVTEIAKSGDLDQVRKNSLLFGSIVYQHAYYVDPTMCEAVASVSDEGVALANGILNRFVGLYLIPGEQVIEGYGWKEAQKAFADAPVEKKSIFVKKSEYDRNSYFGVK